MKKIKSILAVLIISSFVVVGSACSNSSSDGNNSNSELDKTGVSPTPFL
jgi:pyruvate-formate lyase